MDKELRFGHFLQTFLKKRPRYLLGANHRPKFSSPSGLDLLTHDEYPLTVRFRIATSPREELKFICNRRFFHSPSFLPVERTQVHCPIRVNEKGGRPCRLTIYQTALI